MGRRKELTEKIQRSFTIDKSDLDILSNKSDELRSKGFSSNISSALRVIIREWANERLKEN